jgi:hypothetical protein
VQDALVPRNIYLVRILGYFIHIPAVAIPLLGVYTPPSAWAGATITGFPGNGITCFCCLPAALADRHGADQRKPPLSLPRGGGRAAAKSVFPSVLRHISFSTAGGWRSSRPARW